MQFAMPHPACGHDKVSKAFYLPNRPAENGDFETITMVHMHMHAGENEVVVIMLYRSDTIGQIVLVMIVDVAERGDTVTFIPIFQSLGFQFLTYKVAHRLRAVGIAARVHQIVELVRELGIQRDCEAFHAIQ